MSYKAFISYSHAADGQLAPSLQSGLQKFAKPFYRLRAMRIFRDETSLHLTPKLWPTIQHALKDSENFILMASPASAASKWVQAEIDEWLTRQNGLPDKLFIVLTEGGIEWDDSTNDFNYEKSTALPEKLRGKFQAEPLFLDFRWARKSEHLSLRNPQFLRAIGKLAAVLHNKPLDEIVGDDVRQHRVFKLVAGIAIVLLLALATATSITAFLANERRKEALAAAENESLARQAEREQRELAETATNNEKAARKDAEDQRGKAEQKRLEAEEQKKEAKRQQGFAEENAAEARRRLISLYEEQGRRETLSGDPERAMMYLSEAYKEGSKSSPLRFLLAYVATAFDGQISAMIGHNAGVNAIGFSLDGRRLVTAGKDRTAIVWDVATGDVISTLKAEQSTVREVYINSDGRRVITVANHLVSDADVSVIKLWNADTGAEIADLSSERGAFGFSTDNSLFFRILNHEPAIYDAENGKELFKLKGHEQEISQVAFERGNKRLLTSSADKVVLRDSRGKELSWLPPRGVVQSVFFSPSGPRLITKENRALKLWDAETGAQITPFDVPDSSNVVITVSSDGARIATLLLLEFQIWSADNGAKLSAPKIDREFAHFRKFSSDLSLFFTSGSALNLTNLVPDGLLVWDTTSGKLLSSFSVLGESVSSLTLSADSKLIFMFGEDNVGRVWDWRKLSGPTHFDLDLSDVVISSAVFSSDGERIITKYGERGETYTTGVFNTADGEQLPLPTSMKDVKFMAVSPNGRQSLCMEGAKGQVRDVATGAIITTLDRPIRELKQAEFSPNGKLLATRNTETALEIWSAASGAHIGSLTYDKEDDDELFLELVGFKFSPDSTRIVTAILESDEGQMMRADVWSSTTGERLLAKGIGYMGTEYDAFPLLSQDNRRLITPNGTEGQDLGTPLVWDISRQTPKQKFGLKGHLDRVSTMAFDSRGSRILTASADGTAKVWDGQTGALVASLNGHQKEVTSAFFEPLGKLIVTASADSTVKVWNAETGEELATVADHSFHEAKSAAFSPSGNLRILTIIGDNTVRVLDARLENRSPEVLAEMVRHLLPYRFYNGRPLPVARRKSD